MASMFPAASMPDRDWWAALWPDPSSLVRALGVRADMTALDLCCGDGYFTAPLARIVGGRVYALDFDPDMIAQARSEAAQQGVTVLEWIIADAYDVAALIPEPVDFVLLANTFHGAPDKAALATAVAAVLRPGGLFAIVNWHPRPREETIVLGAKRGPPTELRMSPASVREAVKPEGFNLSRLVELPPYHYGAIFERAA
jgi:ubiquinone/menaquinone biosynthesis C-methylase UbiE